MPLTARQVDGAASLSFPQRSRGVLHVGSACSPKIPICREHVGGVGPAREVLKNLNAVRASGAAQGGRGSGGSCFMPKRGTRAGGVRATGETLLKI